MADCIRSLVRKSRSVRIFDESRRIPEETLLELVDIARFCPSGRNHQPIRYLVSTDPAETAAVRGCVRWALDLPDWGGPAEGENPAAYITMATTSGAVPDPRYDVGIAAQTMMLAAVERGFGGCMIGSVDRGALTRQLALPPEFEIHLVLAFGYPAQTIVLDSVPPNGDTRYWRDHDGRHHVPKRALGDVLLAVPKRAPPADDGPGRRR